MCDRCFSQDTEDTDPFVLAALSLHFMTHARDKPRYKLFTSKTFQKTKHVSYKILILLLPIFASGMSHRAFIESMTNNFNGFSGVSFFFLADAMPNALLIGRYTSVFGD